MAGRSFRAKTWPWTKAGRKDLLDRFGTQNARQLSFKRGARGSRNVPNHGVRKVETASPPTEGFVLTHFLVVSDQDRSREFYRSLFGGGFGLLGRHVELPPEQVAELLPQMIGRARKAGSLSERLHNVGAFLRRRDQLATGKGEGALEHSAWAEHRRIPNQVAHNPLRVILRHVCCAPAARRDARSGAPAQAPIDEHACPDAWAVILCARASGALRGSAVGRLGRRAVDRPRLYMASTGQKRSQESAKSDGDGHRRHCALELGDRIRLSGAPQLSPNVHQLRRLPLSANAGRERRSHSCCVPRSRLMPITSATRFMSTSKAKSVAPWRSATAAIMQSIIPRGVTPTRRHAL